MVLPSLTTTCGGSVINGGRTMLPDVDRRWSGRPEVTDDVGVVRCPLWPPSWSLGVVFRATNVAGVILLGSTYSTCR